MRSLTDDQRRFTFFQPTLKESRELYQRYERISILLDRCPEILLAVDGDLVTLLTVPESGGVCKYCSDSVLRFLLVMAIEGLSLRGTTVRVDCTPFLRDFTRVHDGPVMSYASLDRFKNAIRPETWQKINRSLLEATVSNGEVSGNELRVDTTAVETNIHHPTDSALLWDVYRVFSRLIKEVKKYAPELIVKLRLHKKKVKRAVQKISRLVGKKNSRDLMKALYELILKEVERIRDRVLGLVSAIKNRIRDPHYVAQAPYLRAIVQELEHYLTLADSVLDQTTRRVINGESVPNDEKVFSIFEPHTELLKRGKSWRSIEYGHMIQIEQVRSKLITGYEVFSKKPQEPDLLLAIVEKHKSLFGEYPELVTTDKGYSEKEKVAELEDLGIRTSIGRKGRTKSEATHKREHSDEFRSAQAFRAGIEGTIAFLKSGLGLRRCLNKGWSHFAATIGLSVLAHNLIQLAT